MRTLLTLLIDVADEGLDDGVVRSCLLRVRKPCSRSFASIGRATAIDDGWACAGTFDEFDERHSSTSAFRSQAHR